MNIQLRLEEEKDHRLVEEVTREAFWNLFSPGCDEHLLVHTMRGEQEFIKELGFVALHEGQIVGNIMYAETRIISGNEEHKMATFGPVSVLPEYHGKGVGSQLIRHTTHLAKEKGYRAVLIYGDPEYYKRFGFKVSKEYGITNPDKKYPAALLVLELYPGALEGISGIFDEGEIYKVDQEALNEFEKGFPEKEKQFTKTQEWFLEMVNKFI